MSLSRVWIFSLSEKLIRVDIDIILLILPNRCMSYTEMVCFYPEFLIVQQRFLILGTKIMGKGCVY